MMMNIHPRWFETVTYVVDGDLEHKDSFGWRTLV